MRKNSKKLTFPEWVDKVGGTGVVADATGVTRDCVRKWKRGEHPPLAKAIKTMIDMSKGQMTFEIIYRDTTRNI